ncbi:hypothetical protein CLOM_g12675 [Closterium sp. NIES-68]|nr:hypothetical protein CLOM_g12675 [Closterium sp. NIES-68]GJP82776.1 hypothetical protein CLOP_g13011 [Closterium sp. NIES-67]
MMARVSRVSRVSRGTPPLLFLVAVVAALLLAGGGIRGGECMTRPMRLITLPKNALGARCLDGSDPSYFFRPGAAATPPPVKRSVPRATAAPVAGSGQSVNQRWFTSRSSGIVGRRDTWQPMQTPRGDPAIRIHIHLPAGGWCFTALECLNRSTTFLGSSTGWPDTIPDSVPMGGILSDDPDVNPLFADWPLARVNYCDGGGFAGQRGRFNVTIPIGAAAGKQPGRRLGRRLGSSVGRSAGREMGRSAGRQMGSWEGREGREGREGAMRARVLAGMKPGPGGGQAGGGGGQVGSGKQRIAPVYMDGWNIVRTIMDDLKTNLGFKLASQVLVSGSSAGGQAVIYLCDRVAAAFPSATTKCVADSGYFVNSIDRNGTRLWEKLAKSISGTQQLSNPACRKRLPPSRHWACFFPEQALMALKTPIFVIQSLFDVVASAIGGQTRTTPDHNFYNFTATQLCVNELLNIPMPITIFVKSGKWRNVRYKSNYCKIGERAAMYNMAQLVYRGLENASKERTTRAIFLISNGMHGVALMDDRWVGTKVKGVSARDALARWYNSKLNNTFFMHE